ncbi:hypothetical protein EJ07DRAFT_159927 [Lizonia empirigonia]|nr:hypothetical protein EJ07DRAFT_159927 [Lizonia empirigonia]
MADQSISEAAERLCNEALELRRSGNSPSDIEHQLQQSVQTTVASEVRRQVYDLAVRLFEERSVWVNTTAVATQEEGNNVPVNDAIAEEQRPHPQGDPRDQQIQRLMESVAAMESQIRAFQSSLATPAPTSTEGLTPWANLPTKKFQLTKLSDIGKFSGNRRNYRTFRAQMKDHLMGGAYSEVLGVMSIFNRLEGAAASVGLSWKERHPNGTTDEFWTFLDGQYTDNLFEERARQKLQTIQMKKSGQSLEAFNAEFIQLAYDADEADNKKNLKTRYLAAVRPDLQQYMV